MTVLAVLDLPYSTYHVVLGTYSMYKDDNGSTDVCTDTCLSFIPLPQSLPIVAVVCISSNDTKLMAEADIMIQNCISNHISRILSELDGCDPYIYARAYSPGDDLLLALTFDPRLNSLCYLINECSQIICISYVYKCRYARVH